MTALQFSEMVGNYVFLTAMVPITAVFIVGVLFSRTPKYKRF